MEFRTENLTISSPAGELESLLWSTPPDVHPTLAAIVCHPHPLFGGTMHNKVVYQTAKMLRELGQPVLRFNFRGVGLSQGTYDHGRGETQDALAALDFMAAQYPKTPLIAAGFSFGAWVGLRAGCTHENVAELIGLGLPVNDPAFEIMYLQTCRKDKLLIWGDHDIFATNEKRLTLAEALRGPASGTIHVVTVPDADHFFTGRIEEVTKAMRNWLEERYPELGRETERD